MPDFNNITVTVLTLCFGVGVGAVVAASVARAASRRRGMGSLPPLPPGEMEPWPYSPPPPTLPSGKVEVWPYRPFDWLWAGAIVAFFAMLGIGNAASKAATPGCPRGPTTPIEPIPA